MWAGVGLFQKLTWPGRSGASEGTGKREQRWLDRGHSLEEQSCFGGWDRRGPPQKERPQSPSVFYARGLDGLRELPALTVYEVPQRVKKWKE